MMNHEIPSPEKAHRAAVGTRRGAVGFSDTYKFYDRRGAVFIIALAITVILSAMLLVFARQMRVEATSSANRLAAAQADGVEQGAEQWVLAQVEANTPVLPSTGGGGTSLSTSTAVDVTTIPAEALQVGGGYFWLLHPDPLQDQTYAFGIVDESGKLNLNGATSDQLMNLPNMTQDVADAITTWSSSVSTAGQTGTGGAASATIPFESVEEILLAETQSPPAIPQLLYGYDLNRDGVIDATERAAANGAAQTNGTTLDSRGFFNYVTVFSTDAQPTTATSTGGGSTAAGPGGTVVKTVGLINVNTAPMQVLMCLPGITQATAQSLVAARTGTTIAPGDTSWASTALGQAQFQAITPYITGQSYQFSADIVAVSGDGRAFKRVRIVVDARAQPAKIIYRKDLTGLGWPLPLEVQKSLRAGQGVPQDVSGTTNTQTGTNTLPGGGNSIP
jgi:DNA uptake protein ComE-like DNA-binding protein